jgi:putative transcriptional regulator
MATNDDFGELLIEALEEAVAYKEGKRPGLRVTRYEVTARGAAVSPPPSYDAERVRRVRAGLNVSQPVFAGMLNVSSSTVQAWEQGVREPDGASLRLLEIAENHPATLLESVAKPASAGPRKRKQT